MPSTPNTSGIIARTSLAQIAAVVRGAGSSLRDFGIASEASQGACSSACAVGRVGGWPRWQIS